MRRFFLLALLSTRAEAGDLALVYRGPVVGCEGCSEAIAEVLRESRRQFEVKFVGPKESLKLTAAVLKKATLYAQPGGDGDVGKANAVLEKQLGKNSLAEWVKKGGRYYGTCMGGFLVAKPDTLYPEVSDTKWPGLGLLGGTVGEWIVSPKASVTSEKDTVVEIIWRGKARWVYFQDGPHFNVGTDANILASYKSNGLPAMATWTLGKGKVAVSGPHPEATHAWFTKSGVVDPTDADGSKGHARDLAAALVEELSN